jgi:hypothetical protein
MMVVFTKDWLLHWYDVGITMVTLSESGYETWGRLETSSLRRSAENGIRKKGSGMRRSFILHSSYL